MKNYTHCNKLFLFLTLFTLHAQPITATSFVQGLPFEDTVEGFDPEQEFWPWDEIDTNDIHFPKKFLWATATSAHQVEEDCTNNDWSDIEKAKDETGNPRGKAAGKACEHIKYFEKDVERIDALGMNAHRMSVEWSKLEPQQGTYDEAAFKVYDTMFDTLRAHNKEIIVTLHHYTSPKWFMALGGFEKAANIKYFVEFCKHAYTRWSSKVKFWITINAPAGYALKSYLQGEFPPFQKNMKLAAQVIKNLCEAHIQVYKACKAIDKKPQIGILHHVYHIKPYYSWYPVHQITAYFGDMLNNQALLGFFKTGTLSFGPLSLMLGTHTNTDAPHSNDFIGLSFYSHGHLSGFTGKTPTHYAQEIATDKKSFVMYAEGMYHAIQRVAQLGKPIYIMENGIGDKKDAKRQLFLQRYLFAISQAIADGYDVHGYVYWSLLDNYEWLEAYDSRFGLYAIDFATQERTLRPSAQYLADTIKRFASPTPQLALDQKNDDKQM